MRILVGAVASLSFPLFACAQAHKTAATTKLNALQPALTREDIRMV